MLKRLGLAFAGLFAFVQLAIAAGTVPGFSLSQQLDSNGAPLVGCRLYVVQAGTVSTPQNAYQDSGLTLVLPNPLICDAYGRIPAFFVADGSIKLRLTKSNGVQVFSQDGLLVVGASSGGGGGSPVDATTVLQTGDLKPRFGTGSHAGFVPANGRTIGSATSGATERANADCEALFALLWNSGTTITISGGRGVSAAADWAANKTATLPDWRGRALVGLDDMGSSASGRLTSTYFGADPTVLGQAGGGEYQILTRAQLPTGITSRNASQALSVVSSANVTQNAVYISYVNNAGGGTTVLNASPTNSALTSTGTADIIVTSTNTNGDAHPIVQPTMLATIYIKL